MKSPVEGSLEQMWQAIQARDLSALSEQIHAAAGLPDDDPLIQRLSNEREQAPRPRYELEANAYSQPWTGPL